MFRNSLVYWNTLYKEIIMNSNWKWKLCKYVFFAKYRPESEDFFFNIKTFRFFYPKYDAWFYREVWLLNTWEGEYTFLKNFITFFQWPMCMPWYQKHAKSTPSNYMIKFLLYFCQACFDIHFEGFLNFSTFYHLEGVFEKT